MITILNRKDNAVFYILNENGNCISILSKGVITSVTQSSLTTFYANFEIRKLNERKIVLSRERYVIGYNDSPVEYFMYRMIRAITNIFGDNQSNDIAERVTDTIVTALLSIAVSNKNAVEPP